MKAAVRRIDRAIKKLYNIEISYRAEQFLVGRPVAGPSTVKGTLFVKQGEEVELGIYLNPAVRQELPSLRNWNSVQWSDSEMSAFCVAAEEVSHFLLLLQRMIQGGSVSQLELEIQAEIDKFVLAFFSKPLGMRKAERHAFFEALFERFFEKFALVEQLTEEQRGRYLEANEFARRFVRECGGMMVRTEEESEKLLKMLRGFYWGGREEKMRRRK